MMLASDTKSFERLSVVRERVHNLKHESLLRRALMRDHALEQQRESINRENARRRVTDAH